MPAVPQYPLIYLTHANPSCGWQALAPAIAKENLIHEPRSFPESVAPPVLLAAACARASEETTSAPATATASAIAVTSEATIDPELPLAVVHKTASCGCCGVWADHLKAAGFPVEIRDTDDMHPVKRRLGVPAGKASCHTAEIGGYVVEGHVPASDIKRLLKERPTARGLALPGMPAGSPGMEMPDGHVQPYTVELVLADGSTQAFAQHGQGG